MTRWLVACALTLWLATGAFAQDSGADAAWEALALQTEAALASDESSDRALQDLRRRVAAARSGFASAKEQNAERIVTLEAQLIALGPALEGEPPELSAQRADVTAQLALLQAPVRQAEAAFRRADGLITEIDQTLRGRHTAEVLRLGPSPLQLQMWSSAVSKLTRSWTSLLGEITDGWNSAATRAALRANLPVILGYLILALILAFRAQTWVTRAVTFARAEIGTGSGFWSLLDSLARIALPLGALYAVVAAVEAMGLHGLRGALILQALPGWGTIIVLATWLAAQLVDGRGDVFMPKGAQGVALVLAASLVGHAALVQLAAYERYSEAERVVLEFPVVVAASLALIIMASLLKQAKVSDDILSQSILQFIGRGCLIVGIAVVVIGAVGFMNGASALIRSTSQTLMVGAGVIVAQSLFTGLYQMISGRSGENSLIPIIGGLILSLLSLPLLALVWGVRETDLTELWTQFFEGTTLGGVRLSPGTLMAFALVFAAGYAVTRLVQSVLKNRVLPRTSLDAGAQTAVSSGAGYIGFVIAAGLAFAAGGVDLSSLAIVAGALSVGIGFGLQNIVSNFVSGIILLVERPISVGDWIEVGGIHGTVRDISVRSTRIETFDRSDVILPNGDLISGKVTNYTKGNVLGRVMVPVGVSYDSDPHEVRRILLSIAREHDMVLMNPEPAVDFLGFGDSSMDFRIRAVLRDVNFVLSVRNDMNFAIAERFRDAKIEIPFPQRDLHLRTGLEALKPSIKDPS
jgi:potassium-dependent mechanosensitive channel